MNSVEIESLAASVAAIYKLALPVDFARVCREEGIQLAPGEYSPKFHGRSEFHRDEGVFILFHPSPRLVCRLAGCVFRSVTNWAIISSKSTGN